MGNVVKWAQMKDSVYSGPQVFGSCDYVLPAAPNGFDVIVAAVAKPEGGAYNAVTMYDGTAVTYGLLQWTFTSGRLQKLLAQTLRPEVIGDEANKKFRALLGTLTGLTIDAQGRTFHTGNEITSLFALRHICTPPGGAVPRRGKNWDLASQIAVLFSKLGENPSAQKVQISFFKDELKREITLKRPQMGGRTIASFLYPRGWEEGTEGYLQQRAARALFWGMWQNSPAKAQTYLGQMEIDLSTQIGLNTLAKKFAFSPHARWGVAKAKNNKDKDGKSKPYTSRYQKVAEAINDAMGQKIVPEYWK